MKLIKYLNEIEFYEARIRKLEKMSGISDLEEIIYENKELKEKVKELKAENNELREKLNKTE